MRDNFIEWIVSKNITNFRVSDLINANDLNSLSEIKPLWKTSFIHCSLILDGKAIIKI